MLRDLELLDLNADSRCLNVIFSLQTQDQNLAINADHIIKCCCNIDEKTFTQM